MTCLLRLVVLVGALECLVIGSATRDTALIALARCAALVLAVLRRWYRRT